VDNEGMTMSEPDDRLLKPSEVAALFGVNAKTVSRWAKEGKLHPIRTLGGHRRYKASEVLRVIQEGAEERK
jgi:excisionase family DNA binding protein